MAFIGSMRQFVGRARRRLEIEVMRAFLLVDPRSRLRDETRVTSELPPSPAVLFVCHGNICRSPMAERYLRKRARELGIDSLSVRSAGFVETEGRPSPTLAIETAREFGVDLSDHRSTVVTSDLLAWSDIVFLMDVENYCQLRERYADVDHVGFLRTFGDGKLDIRDPVNGDREVFRQVYGEITEAIDRFLGRLTEPAEDSTPRERSRGP